MWAWNCMVYVCTLPYLFAIKLCCRFLVGFFMPCAWACAVPFLCNKSQYKRVAGMRQPLENLCWIGYVGIASVTLLTLVIGANLLLHYFSTVKKLWIIVLWLPFIVFGGVFLFVMAYHLIPQSSCFAILVLKYDKHKMMECALAFFFVCFLWLVT